MSEEYSSPRAIFSAAEPTAAETESLQVIPVTSDATGRGRTVGIVISDGKTVRWQPVVDTEAVARLLAGSAVVVAVSACAAWAAHRSGSHVDRLSMGPGGWVSFRDFAKKNKRPWWAVLLGAHPVNPNQGSR